MPITDVTWATTIIFMFLTSIGIIKHDSIMQLFAVVAGILLMVEFFGSSPYLGFAMGCISTYIAYNALVKDWDRKETG